MKAGRFSLEVVIPFAAAVAAAASILMPSIASAQIEQHRLTVTTRPASPANTCQNAPLPCAGASWDESFGPHEFDIYLAPDYGSYDQARFTLDWDPSWHVQSYEICHGDLQSGDLTTPGSLLVFVFPGCDGLRAPFLRLSMDCPTNGTFSVLNGQVRCGTSYWEGEFYSPHCDIGDFCGMNHQSSCSFCFEDDAGSFDPPSLDIVQPQGQVRVYTLHVWGGIGDACSSLPECGEYHGACFGGLRTDRSWMSAQVDWQGYQDGFHRFPYYLTVNPTTLPPGDYDGRVYAYSGGCGTCRENCMQVHLRLLGPADARTTSGGGSALLSAVTPNPSRGALSYTLRLERAGRVLVEVVDVTGRVVARPASLDLAAGAHPLRWNAGESATDLPSGIYFLRVSTPDGRQSQLFVLTK